MKLLLLIVGLMMSLSVSAQTNYSGIWSLDVSLPTSFFSVTQNGTTIVVAVLDAEDGTWEAYEGNLVGNQTIMQSIFAPGGRISLRVTFQSVTQGQFQIVSCVPNPGYFCSLPTGVPLAIKKIF